MLEPVGAVRAFARDSAGVASRPHDPGVAKPELRQRRAACAASGPRLWTVIRMRMSSGVGLGVFDEDVEVAVVVEDAGVEQLELGLVRSATAILVDQLLRRGTRACGYL